MRRRHHLVGIALLMLTIGIGCAIIPRNAQPGDLPALMPGLELGDIDQDGKPERLAFLDAGKGRGMVRLTSSVGPKDHDVLMFTLPATPLHAEPGSDQWRVVDEQGVERLSIRIFREPDPLAPDLIVRGDLQAKRFHWIERGYLKLDAQTVIPGFSVGLVMLHDTPDLLTALGARKDAQGSWDVAVLPGARMRATATSDEGVTRITYDAAGLVTTSGVRRGAPKGTLQTSFPGYMKGKRYISPRYGLIADLDQTGRAAAFTVSRPWRDTSAAPGKPASNKDTATPKK